MNKDEKKALILETRSFLEHAQRGDADEKEVCILDYRKEIEEFGGKLLFESANCCVVSVSLATAPENFALVYWEKGEESFRVRWVLYTQPRERNQKKQLLLRGKSGTQYLLESTDIAYIEASNMDCIIHCADGRKVKAREVFGSLCTRLPGGFCRIHRSFAVNKAAVQSVQPYSVNLRGGASLPIPEKRYRRIRGELTR